MNPGQQEYKVVVLTEY